MAFLQAYCCSNVPSGSVYAEAMSVESNSVAKFNDQGELVRPSGYREWMYIGSPLTPNDMNNGKAAFPEFHNVYLDKPAWEHWKKPAKLKKEA